MADEPKFLCRKSVVPDGVVGNDPIGREGEIRSRMCTGAVTDRPVLLNTHAKVVVEEIVCDRECRAIHINAVVLVADR